MKRQVLVGACGLLVLLGTTTASSAVPAREAAGAATPRALRPVADAFVSAADARRTFGRARSLRAATSPQMRSYLRFDLRGVKGPITRATLQLYTKTRSRRPFLVRGVRGNRWSERSITYANAPGLSVKIGSSGTFRAGVRTGIDVTRYVRGKKLVSFALLATGGASIRLSARESGVTGPRLALQTGPRAAGGTLVAAGSIADCGQRGDEQTAALVRRMPGTVAALGDLAYDGGTAQQFSGCYNASWGTFKGRTRPTPGNREYATPNAAAYFSYFGTLAGERGKGYYSYDLGSWHIVVLNTNCGAVGGCGADSPQVKWLETDLGANAARCTLAYGHHARFSSSSTGNNYVSDPSLKPLWDVLYAKGVDVALAGHGRRYERFAPQTPAGDADAARGIRQFIVSTGGVGTVPVGPPIGNSEVRNDGTFGVLRLHLKQGGYDWQFVPVAGMTFSDAGTGTCH